MQRIAYLVGSGVLVVLAGAAPAQQSQGTVRTTPLVLESPSRYDIRCELQPVRELVVSAPVSGTVREVSPKLGDEVRPRSPLVRLDSTLEEIAVARAAAQVKAAAAELEALKQQSPSPAATAKAEAALAIAQANKAEADYWLSRTTVEAPLAGQITELRVHEGQYVAAGQALMTITDYQSVVVWMPWDANDAKRGAKVALSIEEQKHNGEIKAVVPVIAAHRRLDALRGRLATVVIEFDNQQHGLSPGQRVACPLLPLGPVARLDNNYIHGNNKLSGTVYVLRGDVVRHIQVRKHAIPSKGYTTVSGSFQEGDELITSTSRAMADGTQIDPKNVQRST